MKRSIFHWGKKPDLVSGHAGLLVSTALLHIVLGHRLAVDVVGVFSVDPHGKETFERFSLAMAAYGYFGDLVKKSEKLR